MSLERGLKVLSSTAMAELEKKAYQQGYQETDFMEGAGRGIALATHNYIEEHHYPKQITLLCGKGNNGGDAFVAGCYLLQEGYHVQAIQLDSLDKCSPLCKKNGERFIEMGGKVSNQIKFSGLILDGIFGTGFKGKVSAPYSLLIETANQSKCPILAIDIPSGLNGTTGEVEGLAIHANLTLFLGLPKTGFFLRDGWNTVGSLQKVDFGLPPNLIDQADTNLHVLTHVKSLIPPMKRNRHKYQSGYVAGLAGSPTMPGAALLSCLAAFRGGSGMVRLFYPQGMESALSASPYELIKIPYSFENLNDILENFQKAGAIFAGPGLGRNNDTQKLLESLIPSLKQPCVLDADALTLFAEKPYKLPPQVIMTPHTGEMERLLKAEVHLDEETLKKCQYFAEENQVTLLLKGAPTFIFHPASPIYVNPTGDPGMATAGSGDVLTGLLASLLSQKLSCHCAAMLGVFLHGLAGECAAKKRGTSIGIMATDIIDCFADAFSHLN